MKNHKCKDICQLLSPFLDNELHGEEQKIVQEHLDTCPQCQEEYSELLELRKIMNEIGKEELKAPDDFVQSVMEKIEEENAEKVQEKVQDKGIVYSLLDKVFKKPWIPVVIAAMLLVAIYIPEVLGPLSSNQDMAKSNTDSGQAADIGVFTTGMTRQNLPEMAPAPGMDMMDENQSLENKTVGEETDRKIIRNGYLAIDVTNYKKTESDLKSKAGQLGGYISGSNSYYYGENQDLLAGSVTLRIPENAFDEMVTFLETMGKVTNKNIYTNDVTEELFDINTRINNLKIKEGRLLEILTKQGDLKDLLAVENEIANTRSEIESLEGRLQLLSSQVSFSSIEVNIKEVRNLEESISKDSVTGLGSKIKESIFKSVNLLIDLGVKGIIFISSALPFLLILIILYFIFRGFWNKKNRDL